jgi:antitoxin component YwqK of YwqJK toxin-antitoxin module
MNKLLFFLLLTLSISPPSFGQSLNEKILYIIDSIPLFNDPEEWNPIAKEEIADIIVIKNKDSLKRLRPEQLDGIVYIFTKAYRNRPDSLKKIPSLKQMVMKNEVWNLNGIPYSGKYIDYYNSGKIQNEATLLNGKLDGELIVYFKNGNRKLVSNYKEGILHGVWNEYYPNGILMNSRKYAYAKVIGHGTYYFVTGQIMNEIKPKKRTLYDTSFSYYSTGKVKEMKLIKNGKPVLDKRINDFNANTTYFFLSINTGKLNDANKYFYSIWKVDSTSSDTHFKKGLLLMKEFRFDAAIEAFDEALRLEPLMRESLVHRAVARIKKYKYPNAKPLSKDNKEIPLTLEDIISIPGDEQTKICMDLRQAVYVDFSEFYVPKIVPFSILNYCQNK